MQCKTLMQIMAQNLICKYEENSECRLTLTVEKCLSVKKCLLPSVNKMTTFKIVEEPREHNMMKMFQQSSMHILCKAMGGMQTDPQCVTLL